MADSGHNVARGVGKTAYDPALHHRRSIRLRGHDYAAGGLYALPLASSVVIGQLAPAGMKFSNYGSNPKAIKTTAVTNRVTVATNATEVLFAHEGGGSIQSLRLTVQLALSAPPATSHEILIDYEPMNMPAPLVASGTSRELLQWTCASAVGEIKDPQGVVKDVKISGTNLSAILVAQPGQYTLYVRQSEPCVWTPVTIQVKPGALPSAGSRKRGLARRARQARRRTHWIWRRSGMPRRST